MSTDEASPPPSPSYIDVGKTATLVVGDTAERVVAEILSTHPQIARLAYVRYDPWYDSEGPIREDILIEIKRTSYILQELRVLAEEFEYIYNEAHSAEEEYDEEADTTGDEDVEDVEPKEDEFDIADHRSLALCSYVVLEDGTRMHIPMLDFASGATNLSPERFSQEVKNLSLPPGAILDSGNSFHYWGFDLMTPDQWSSFMGRQWDLQFINHIRDFDLDVLDVTFIENSISRGYSSLRLFEHPYHYLRVEPKIVGFVN